MKAEIKIRHEGFATGRPWSADVYWAEGQVWKSWMYNYKTKKALLTAIHAVVDGLGDPGDFQITETKNRLAFNPL